MILSFHCKQKNQLAQNEHTIISELAELEQILEIENNIERPGKSLNIPEKPRVADKNNPPIVLDILAARSDIRDISLTNLYSTVKYVPIRFNHQSDTVWEAFGWDNFEFTITPNNIFASNFAYGINQFDLFGNYKTNIVKNDFYYTAIPGRKAAMVSQEDRQQFVGAKGQIHAIGDIIYYQYHNNHELKSSMLKFDASPGVLNQMPLGTADENQKNIPKGSPIFSMPNSEQKGMTSYMGARNTFPISENEWVSTMGVIGSSKSGSFMVSTNTNGDTLTKFRDHDPIRNYTGGNYRSLDGGGTQYNLNGTQHIRQSHNDTIYELNASDQLKAKYVLDFGEKGIMSTMEGISTKTNLTEKFIINDFIETIKYIFIIYTKNAPSPNSAKKGVLFYSACIYDKAKNELFHVYVDEKPFVPLTSSWPRKPINFMKNNYDNGPAFWPEKTTHDGSPFMAIKASDIKDNTNLWKGNEAMIDNIKKMKKTDYILMIAE